MKDVIKCGAAIVGLLFSLSVHSQADEQCELLKVATHPYYPPFHYSESDQLMGPTINMANAIGAALQIPVEVQLPTPWKRVLDNARVGAIDMVLGLRRTPERLQYLTYVDTPIFANPAQVFAHKDRHSSLNTWLDLASLNGAISLGDTFGDEFAAFQAQFLDITSASQQQNLLKMLSTGRVDYVITGRLTGRALAKELGLKPDDWDSGLQVSGGMIFLALSKQSPCVAKQDDIDKALKQFMRERRFTSQVAALYQ